MSSRVVSFAGYAVIGLLWVVWGAISLLRPSLVTLGGVVKRITSSLGLRIVLFLGWGWLGWHLFARGSGAFK
jgi:hypothetical protein